MVRQRFRLFGGCVDSRLLSLIFFFVVEIRHAFRDDRQCRGVEGGGKKSGSRVPHRVVYDQCNPQSLLFSCSGCD